MQCFHGLAFGQVLGGSEPPEADFHFGFDQFPDYAVVAGLCLRREFQWHSQVYLRGLAPFRREGLYVYSVACIEHNLSAAGLMSGYYAGVKVGFVYRQGQVFGTGGTTLYGGLKGFATVNFILTEDYRLIAEVEIISGALG